MFLERGKARVHCLQRCTPGNIQGECLKARNPNFPCFWRCTLKIAGGASLEVGKAGQLLTRPERPDPAQGFLGHARPGSSNPGNTCLGLQASSGSSGLPVLSCHKTNRCLLQLSGTIYYYLWLQPHCGMTKSMDVYLLSLCATLKITLVAQRQRKVMPILPYSIYHFVIWVCLCERSREERKFCLDIHGYIFTPIKISCP